MFCFLCTSLCVCQVCVAYCFVILLLCVCSCACVCVCFRLLYVKLLWVSWLSFAVVLCFASVGYTFFLSAQLRHSEMCWLLCGPPLSYICFASCCNLSLANTFTITYQVHITMCHPYLTTGTLNSAQTHRLSRWVCSTKSVSLRCWPFTVHCILDVVVRYFSLWYDHAFVCCLHLQCYVRWLYPPFAL